MDAVFVLGNGPSLRGVELEGFSDVPTIGMNAAYRHWERIGWYPTHYCCLDDALIGTHHYAIASLLHERLVRTALVTARMLEFHPELGDDERCHVFERLHRPSFDARGRKLGLSFVPHAAFRASEPWKVTTGAYAVRYGIFLGYRFLYLLGIDCRYVDAAVAARPIGGLTLELTHTPESNPNYFFDDYQRAGDRYQVANPPIYGDNLHLQSLELVRDDVAQLDDRIEIRVCSPESELVSRGVFPYEDLGRALRRGRGGTAEPGEEFPLDESTRAKEPTSVRPSTDPRDTSGSWTPPKPSLYERSYLWAKTRSRTLFLAGRIMMVFARAVRALAKGRVSRWL